MWELCLIIVLIIAILYISQNRGKTIKYICRDSLVLIRKNGAQEINRCEYPRFVHNYARELRNKGRHINDNNLSFRVALGQALAKYVQVSCNIEQQFADYLQSKQDQQIIDLTDFDNLEVRPIPVKQPENDEGSENGGSIHKSQSVQTLVSDYKPLIGIPSTISMQRTPGEYFAPNSEIEMDKWRGSSPSKVKSTINSVNEWD